MTRIIGSVSTNNTWATPTKLCPWSFNKSTHNTQYVPAENVQALGCNKSRHCCCCLYQKSSFVLTSEFSFFRLSVCPKRVTNGTLAGAFEQPPNKSISKRSSSSPLKSRGKCHEKLPRFVPGSVPRSPILSSCAPSRASPTWTPAFVRLVPGFQQQE